MNFLNDPLADLSDNDDSFFEDPKVLRKRASLTKTPEKKSITDIFNINDDNAPETSSAKKTDDWLGLGSEEAVSKNSPAITPKLSKKISFDDDNDDILGGLGLSRKTQGQTENQAKTKVDLLESILGPKKPEEVKRHPSTFDNILQESKAKRAVSPVADSFAEAPREGRRGAGRRPSAGLLDPLGLFSETKPPTPKKEEPKGLSEATLSKSTPNISQQGMPEWLGTSAIKPSRSENVLSKKIEEKLPEAPPIPLITKAATPEISTAQNEESETMLNAMLTQQKLTQSHLEYQNTATALQQQESQLLMALQLKKYEENLGDIQRKQQEVLVKQEQQFNTLLERQFAKQQIMENNMRLQQERINNHIQMLVGQPSFTKHIDNDKMEDIKKNQSEQTVQMYEKLVDTLKQRQNEEIFLLEESYKKQISLLEQTLESVEKRLKIDVEKLGETFEEKFTDHHRQHKEEIQKYKQKIQEMEVQHLDEIKQMRDHNTSIINEIKYEHSTLLENIKETKKSETTLFQESGSYLQKLDSNINILYSNSQNLEEMKSRFDQDYGILTKAREESLKAKEEEIRLMRATLEKCRESAEKERAELLSLVRTLETKIAEQNQNSREERWAFQQAASTLAARSAALDRESEFNRNSIEREREQLKSLRESILAEQEKMMLQLTEEKLLISAEKSRLEASSQLQMNFDSQKAKIEMESAMQVAKEVTEITDKEREKLHREKCDIEKIKRALQDQERKLNMKERELDEVMYESRRKMEEGEKAIEEARTMESKYNDRLRDLQKQLIVLSNREKKLAEEKIMLSKERLNFTAAMRQNKKCGLCSADQKMEEANLNTNTLYYSRFDSIDNDLIRLRLEATSDVLNAEENVPIQSSDYKNF